MSLVSEGSLPERAENGNDLQWRDLLLHMLSKFIYKKLDASSKSS